MPTETAIREEIKKGNALSIVDLVRHILQYAHAVRASDVHIDPAHGKLRVRMRIDGVLHENFSLPKNIHNEVISRVKVLAGLRTDEHQSAQDGRFRMDGGQSGAPLDVRVSIAPTYHGENAVLRLLADTSAQYTLESLGFRESDREKILRAVRTPNGMVLATGPTGSGKTTTLYTLVKLLNTPDISIVTIEDPIEYAIEDIEQIQVNPRTGLTFAQGLRSILRQDPNIIMVGEIRDADTAAIAVNAALTGHLIFSTLHTSDTATTLPRLLDMKIEPYLIASTVTAVVGQRLVRKICEHCQSRVKITDAEQESVRRVLGEAGVGPGGKFSKGNGCEACANTGYHGRICVNEVLIVDDEIRDAIVRKASAREIETIAIKNGMTTMLYDAFLKARAGLTTVEEVFRVIRE
ncbi:hypothetical protein A2761_00045 [Candidatus Kaiserbacteria bacterium RIFCSPHIGHO2_01_FULL_51_33]|uniref:AAA+ ATPase domain-containing protein n=1 Tax=Candidatus Kaiserbacteria bacterium RIFCSPLOWO2_01_FULL_51_21 TaxID=1798508 RepID=A0A1F6ECS6_9BACT|nr:MAG: hypothetical protein A2761_00045 [Candidatus Kaiserbacteria bacterium RIFCSPHIGHO2_01_FULL_51_33]OGG71478.1 MAG: hypothetical protein A3A35_03080 [Candidatus Kaiserbacteria bacterium RIFCSPLOWO2_01_FULL_51_21]